MVYITGDIHGDINKVEDFCEFYNTTQKDILILLGDVGFNYYLNELKLNINDAYTLSWDDKYDELCKKENKTVNKIVRFNMEMPKETNKFNIDK